MYRSFQILCGVPPDQWHTTITVEDVTTYVIISKMDFPNTPMYDADAYELYNSVYPDRVLLILDVSKWWCENFYKNDFS